MQSTLSKTPFQRLFTVFLSFAQTSFSFSLSCYKFVRLPCTIYMQSLITQGVEISVETFYQPEYSQPLLHEYMFAYRITLENHNNFTIQLLSRQWYIFDSNGDYRQVEGEGVVGQQPILQPGESFQYVSGCNLKSEMGKMWGYYNMINLNHNTAFKATIPDFSLIAPMKLS
jgi:ApaG protein